MIDTLIVVKDNNYGLTRDASLLASAIRDAGVEAEIAKISDRSLIDHLFKRRRARRIIHLERIFPRWLSAGEENLVVPNQERFPERHVGRLRRIDAVLAKTIEASVAFAGYGVSVEHLGFSSQDRFDPSVKKNWNRFLHLAGGSTLKGTEDVLSLWHEHPEWPELVLVQKQENAPRHVPENVKLVTGYLSDADLRRFQNECGIHLCPSRSEGWGHNIVEGLSCSALLIATDGAPMNEHVRSQFGLLVKAASTAKRHLGTNYFVDRNALAAAIETAIATPWSRKAAMGELARRRFVDIDRGFRENVGALLGANGQRSRSRPAS